MIEVIEGDCLVVLPTLPADSFHACVTDPPYHLTSIVRRFGAANAAPAQHGTDGAYARASRGFMGKQWDGGDVAFRPETWAAILRVLKPGAHLLAFGGTRTYHRLACAIEDAGFEVRDAIMWHYGSGFPKSHDVSKGIDRAAGVERAVIAEGAPVKRIIPGADQDATGSWLKDNGRLFVPTETAPATDAARQWSGWGTALKPATEIICVARKPLIGTVAANVLQHGCGALNIGGCRVPAEIATGWGGAPAGGETWTSENCGLAKAGAPRPVEGRWPANLIHDGSDEVLAAFPSAPGQQRFVGEKHGDRDSVNCYGDYGPRPDTPPRGDAGSAARFFYTAKADKSDRLGSKHPTVKPVDLVRYLVRLVTSPGGRLLDPFAGSGTTGMAPMAEGFDCTMIERDPQSVADCRRRIAHVSGADAPLFAGEK